MNVLSLFDGMSCGQQALQRTGLKVDNYYASEIDKYAIKVTMANYPHTIQLGNVSDINGYDLPKIDLLIGGSPCQSFSFAGKRKGMSTKCETEILTLEQYLKLKSEGFEFEGQSYLFWEYMRLLKEVKPKYFLLENVEMGEKWEKVLSKAIGVNGIHINSSLLSAQNRKRIYWTNIGMQPMGLFGDMQSIIQQPKDKGILLKDILEEEVDEKYFLSQKSIDYINRNPRNLTFQMNEDDDKSGCIVARYQSGIPYNQIVLNDKIFSGLDINAKGKTIRTGGSGSTTNKHNWDLIIDPNYGNKRLNETIKKHKNNLQNGTQIDSYNQSIHNDKSIALSTTTDKAGNTHIIVDNTMPRSSTTGKGGTGHLSRNNGKTYCLDTGNTNAIEIRDIKQVNQSNESGGKQPYQQNRIYDISGISPAICANKSDLLITSGTLRNKKIRRLTPIECERLQTVSDNYTNQVSDSQRYKMLGNGWTIDVIAYIFSYINN